jgi:ADP-heptose:LPS heptosyltransferase
MPRSMRILFITSNRIGDAVLSTGLLDHLLRTYPAARFTIACGPVAEGLFTHMPRRDGTIVMEKRRFGRHWLPLWWHAVRRRWDLVVDIRASAMGYIVPTGRRAVMRKSTGHKTVQLARLLQLAPAPLPVVWTSAADRAQAERLLPQGTPIIALGPTANWTGKVWPPERFAALATALRGHALPGARIAVFAGPGPFEAGLAAPLLAALPEAIDLTGQLTLSQAAACLARCALFVGNDSGLMHLAAAAGTATLGLFGPTPSAEYGPAGRLAAPVVSASTAMADLSVDQVVQAVHDLLNQQVLNAAQQPD